MKILITRAQGAGGRSGVERLRQTFPQIEFIQVSTPEELREQIVDADAVIGGQLTQEDVLAARRLRWMHSSGVGVRLDKVPALVESDIVVTNPRGAPSVTMAEHAFAMLLTLTRRLREAENFRKQRLWKMQDQPDVLALAGLTMGILGGLGSIGTAIARRAHGFEMEVVAIDTLTSQPSPYVSEIVSPDRLSEILPRLDILSIAAPLNSYTRGMIGATQLKMMKPTAYIVNVARGAIIQERALAEALKARRIAGACLDVFESSPASLPPDSPFWDLDNVIITAHCSGRSTYTDENRYKIALENVTRFVNGQPLINVVDKIAVSQ